MNSQSLMANLGLDRIRRTSTDPDRSLVLKWVHPSSDWPDRALVMCPLKLRWDGQFLFQNACGSG